MIQWIRSHIQPVMLLLGAIAMALKPEIVGTSHFGTVGWLTVGLTIAGAVGTYIAPNIVGAVGIEVKNGIAVITVGFATAINVAPNGFSRADLWTVSTAIVVVAVPLLFPNTQPKAVLQGAGRMGISAR